MVLLSPVELTREFIIWADAHKKGDTEKTINQVGKISQVMQSVVWLTTRCLQVPVSLATYISDYAFFNKLPWHQWSVAAMVTFIPLGIALAALTLIAAIFETIQLNRSVKLLKKVFNWNSQEEIVKKMEWVHATFFSLHKKEHKEIQAFIQRIGGQFSDKEIKEKFNRMISSFLDIRYAILERRVGPRLAKELCTKIDGILVDLHSKDPARVQRGCEASTELLQDMKTQSIKRISIHLLGILALTLLFITTMIAFFNPIAAPVAIAFGVIGLTLGITGYLIESGVYSQKGWHFSAKACIPQVVQNFASGVFKRLPKLASRSLSVA